ncbi:PREDICTED: cytochrome c biogenesis protein CCS1, chloroplastic isoform X2 [Tarenaya hassleriana]|uniref:cytochrome c biogenesis protein CCS1, chloroplastic isoform X2 n=1 Tax=Tarenaya hassleriana TaxID=28532 RepID=UPI00053C3559|nr:PREDICTED: cytochrome c biogenesis protein CCS1, chloroplastic isoform X2 [Tarenaya hassleriana]
MILTLNPTIPFSPKSFPRSTLRLCSSNYYGTKIVTCKLRTPQDGIAKAKSGSGDITKKILLSNSAPPVTEDVGESGGDGGGEESGDRLVRGGGSLGLLKRFPRRVLSVLSNLPLAITEMFSIAALMALGTVIEQGETPDFYFEKYPEDSPVLGFFTWRWVLSLGLDHMYSSPIFLGMLVLLAASLMACTYTTQIPLVKVARRWSFMKSDEAVKKQDFSDSLPRASIQDLGVILMGSGYEVFMKGPSLYAFRGLAGRFAPIGVHLAMILIMVGGTLSATGSFRGSVTVPQGLNFVMGDVLGPTGFLSNPTEAFNTEVHINRFSMDYYESGEVSKDGEGPFNLPMAPIKINGDKKLFGTFLPVGETDSSNVKGISMLARDLQSIVLYDTEGKFSGVRRPNSKLPIEIDGMKIVIEDAIGSSGLELKTDPGVPFVYAGFGALMLTTCISYLSHSQIWALQNGTTVTVGGRTNRAKAEFPDEMNRLLDQVPELIEHSTDG